nr:hypothetical protein Q903MT_gene4569 [Picea sitchensis]
MRSIAFWGRPIWIIVGPELDFCLFPTWHFLMPSYKQASTHLLRL